MASPPRYLVMPCIRENYTQALHGYLPLLTTASDVEARVVATRMGDQAGVIAALHLAQGVLSLSTTATKSGGLTRQTRHLA
jgi:hypothetical protein